MSVLRNKLIKNDKKLFINDIYLFSLLFSGSLMLIISNYIKLDMLMGYLFLLLAFVVVLYNQFKLYKNVIFVFWIFCFLILFNMLFRYNPQQIVYLFNLFTFGIIGMLCALCEVDYKRVYKWGTIYGVIWILINLNNSFSYAIEEPFAFGYLMLPIIYSTFLYMQNCKNNKKKYILLVLFLFYLLFIAIQYSARGALINLFIFSFLKLITSNKKSYRFVAIIMAIIAYYVVTNIEKAMTLINSLPYLKLYVVKKTLYLIQANDTMSGRLELYVNAIKSINGIDWLFGIGFGKYGYSFSGAYPHNIFISVLLDFGLIGVLIFLILITKYFIVMFRCQDENKLNFMIVIFSLSIGVLMWSMDYMTSIPFYIFLGMASKEKLTKKISSQNINSKYREG